MHALLCNGTLKWTFVTQDKLKTINWHMFINVHLSHVIVVPHNHVRVILYCVWSYILYCGNNTKEFRSAHKL